MAATTQAAPLVHVSRRGGLLACALNRPRALNALTLEMVRELAAGPFAALAADDSCRVLLLRGEGGRAFCAGGDMKAVAHDAQSGGQLSRRFFAEEYALNAAIAESAKPQVSLWDGIVMGGGVGLSVHGRFRVATERTLFAMPETAIGFFPDVGASHFFQRLPRATATYLALTGARLGARDVCELGLATHFVPSAALGGLEAGLEACAGESDVSALLERLSGGASPPEPDAASPSLTEHRAAIERCFGAPSVRALLDALGAERTAWAADALSALRARSPVALVATLALLRRCATAPLRECLAAEYALAQHFTTAADISGGGDAGPTAAAADFFEGVRAVLVDKDHAPRWCTSIDALDPQAEAAIEGACFAPCEDARTAGVVARLREGRPPFDDVPAGGGAPTVVPPSSSVRGRL